jgi:hypothetical protein
LIRGDYSPSIRNKQIASVFKEAGIIGQYHLNDLSRKTERYIKQKIRSLVLTRQEYDELMPKIRKRPSVLIWEAKEKAGL